MENEKIINDAVTLLSHKLGTTAQHLWEVLIKQAPYSSAIDLLAFIIICVATFLCIIICFHCWEKTNENGEFIGVSVLTTILATIGVIFCFSILFDMSTWLSGLYNPEYWALDQVMSMIKNH